MSRCIFFFFLLSLGFGLQGQKLDSLIVEFDNAGSDSLRTRILTELSSKAFGINIDSSFFYARISARLAEKNGFVQFLAKNYDQMSKVYINKGLADSAAFCTEKSINIYKSLKDSLGLAFAYERFGTATERQGDYKNAQENYFKALEIGERNNYILPQIEALNSLAIFSLGQREVPSAIRYLDRSLDLAEKNNLIPKIVRACINLSVAHDSLDVRKDYLNRALSLALPLNLQRELAYIYGAKASILYSEEKYQEGIDNQRKQVEIHEKMGNRVGVLRAKNFISLYLMELNRDKEAEKELKEILMQSDYQDYKTIPYRSLERLSRALYNQEKYIEAFDTLHSAYNKAKIVYEQNIEDNSADANTKYESLQKEEEIARQELEISRQKANRNQIAGIGGILLMISIGSGLWYYQKQTAKKKITEIALESEKKEREKLQELDQLKTQFFTNVSHELKTPLTLILGPLANTLEKINNDEVKQDVLLAYNNAERLHDLINETLDFSKLESGKLEIVKSPVLISETLKRSFLSFQSLAEMKNIMLRFNSTIGDETYVSCDYGKLEKIVNNLVSNAIKFSENNSLVMLSANIADNLTIEVADQGKGVPTEEQEKIFNLFYQAKHNRYGNYGGSGVGLAYSKELAEVMNGTLSIKSSPGSGSTLILTIPAQIVSAPIVQEEKKIEDKNEEPLTYASLLIDGEKPKLLIVEDNPEMQQYLMGILGDTYQCILANDGYEAIKMVQTNSFHLISSDIMMPNMDGFALKAKINEISGNRSIPFIFLSARSQDEDVLEGLQLGVDDYITKPFNKYEYLARIHNLLTNRKERIDSLASFGSNENTESVDVKILKDVERDILANLNNTDYKVSNLAESMHYSHRQLGRIVKQLTGMSPIELILELRLQKAHRLLKKKQFSSISEVRYEVGIESPSYFARKFKERFGVSPSEV